MIHHSCVQGSTEWAMLRVGRPTSSEFSKIITPGGQPSKSAAGYINALLVETMLGRPLGGVEMPWMRDGKDREAEAVKYYELIRDVETEVVGFLTTDDLRVGSSPDRLIPGGGVLEVKSPTETTHSVYLSAYIDTLLGSGAIGSVQDAYKCQLQGELYVSERDWADILSYYIGLPEVITRVHRDEPFIAKLKGELDKFLCLFDARLEKLRALGYLDAAAAQARSTKRAPEPEIGGLGVSDSDIDAYVAELKRKGQLPGGEKAEVA